MACPLGVQVQLQVRLDHLKDDWSLSPTLLIYRELEVLDLGNNKIQDTFPNWLESLLKLQVLILRSNKLYGEICIPKTKFPFQKLHIIDLSNNRFSSLLPTKYFEHWMAMINSQEHELKYIWERATIKILW